MQSLLIVNSVLLWVVLLFNLLLTLALVRKLTSGMQKQNGLNKGVKAPNFTVQTLEGKTVSLTNFVGKQVIFLFISPYCKPCKEKMPEYLAISPKAKRAGVELVLVDVNGTVADMQDMLYELKIDLPVLFAPQESSPFTKDYKIGGTPSYCLVDETGKVQSSGYADLKDGGGMKQLVDAWGNGTEGTMQLTPAEV